MANAILTDAHLTDDVVGTAYEIQPRSRSALARGPRLGLTMGGLALGAMLGFFSAMWIGRSDLILNSAGVAAFALSLPLSMLALRQCAREHAYGCAFVVLLHVASLIGWLAMSVGAYGPPLFVAAPALGTLLLFASCWTRSEGGIYRTALQAFILGIAASAQFLFLMVAH